MVGEVGIVTLASGNGLRYQLDRDTIRCREKAVETSLALADVVRVRTAMFTGDAFMELSTRDGRKLVVLSRRGLHLPTARPHARDEYRVFAIELHRRLAAAGKTIAFVGGLFFARPYDPLAIPDKWLP